MSRAQRTLALPGGIASYARTEPVRGRVPVVLVHGAGCNHHFFDAVAEALPEVDLITPALPGRCGSEGRPLQRIADMASWLGSFVDTLGLESLVLGGHSMGAAVAMELALTLREGSSLEVRGLVLLATGARLRVQPKILRMMREAVKSGAIVDVGRFAYHPDSPPELVDAAEHMRGQTSSEASLGDWLAGNRFDRVESLSALEHPALILAGDDDFITPREYAEELHDLLPEGQLIFLERAGHMFPLEREDEVAGHLRMFLARFA